MSLPRGFKRVRRHKTKRPPVVEQIHETMQRLAEVRPIFHSEADFQHALVWQIREDHPEAEARLETRPLPDEALFLDAFVRLADDRVAIECKYMTDALSATVADEEFILRHQSAHDVRRYDVLKDIRRLERIVDAGAAEAGLAIVVTNSSAYWNPPSGTGTNDEHFRIHEGQDLQGSLAWHPKTGAGTSQGREDPIVLRGNYRLEWSDYSSPASGPGGTFRYLAVLVEMEERT